MAVKVGLEILARRALWAVTPPAWRGSIELWHATFVDTLPLPPPPATVTVLDLGAYVGDFAYAAVASLRRRGNRVALTLVEPVFTDLAAAAARELHRGKVQVQVRPVAVAADGRHGKAKMYVPGAHRGLGATLYGAHRDVSPTTRQVTVETVPLSDLILEHARIDLVKCNIEGAECALADLQPWVLQRTRQWVVEFHAHAFPGSLGNAPILRRVTALFATAGFEAVQTHNYGPTIRFVRVGDP